jgi:hypothetical protein
MQKVATKTVRDARVKGRAERRDIEPETLWSSAKHSACQPLCYVRHALMSKARWLALASLTLVVCGASLGACSADDRPSSLVSAGGESGHGSGNAGHGGGTSGDAGQANDDAGNHSGDGDDGGAAGEGNLAPAPLAIFPRQLQVDVGCGPNTDSVALIIRNDGTLPLTISDATTSAGYVVKGQLPLEIAPSASQALSVTAPPPKVTASVGDTSSGTLTFFTNEADSPSHQVLLQTTLFGGQFDFTDSNGVPLSNGLPLTYLSSAVCPDNVTYRVHNTGNLAFTLIGPTFPSHLGGTSTGASGQNVAPDGYVEFTVGGNSSTDGACSGGGALTFTVQGSFCGPVPKLSVSWPANIETVGCTCTAATD